MNILGNSNITYKQLLTWAKNVRTANPLLIKNLPIIWRVAKERGILVEVFISQICVETGYFNFKGVLNASFHNTCGLKTTKGGGDYDANAHMRFSSWEEGIKAHGDHLALYAGAKGFPRYSPQTKNYSNEKYKGNGTTQDPRHFTYLYGKYKTVESLSGVWATSKTYHKTILNLVNQIRNTKVSNIQYNNGDYNTNARIIAKALNIRKGRPSSQQYNQIVGTYKQGDIVKVHYCLDNWFGVIYNNQQCFISGSYVELI